MMLPAFSVIVLLTTGDVALIFAAEMLFKPGVLFVFDASVPSSGTMICSALPLRFS
jgi:hypothetical protein